MVLAKTDSEVYQETVEAGRREAVEGHESYMANNRLHREVLQLEREAALLSIEASKALLAVVAHKEENLNGQ